MKFSRMTVDVSEARYGRRALRFRALRYRVQPSSAWWPTGPPPPTYLVATRDLEREDIQEALHFDGGD